MITRSASVSQCISPTFVNLHHPREQVLVQNHVEPCEKRLSCIECFPYVCPEPVLAKWFVSSVEMAQKGVFRTEDIKARHGRVAIMRMKFRSRCREVMCAQKLRAQLLDPPETTKRHFSLNFSQCLSRACLGKTIIFRHTWYIKMAPKKGGHFSHLQTACGSPFPWTREASDALM